MHRAYLFIIFLFTLISLLSCTTISSPEHSEDSEAVQTVAETEAERSAEAADEATAETDGNTDGKTSSAAHSRDIVDLAGLSEIAETTETVETSEIDRPSAVETTAGAESNGSVGEPSDRVRLPEKTLETPPRATLPDYLPAERKDTRRFLMLSPQIAKETAAARRAPADRRSDSKPEARRGEAAEADTEREKSGPADGTDEGPDESPGEGPSAAEAEQESEKKTAEAGQAEDAESSDIEVIRAGKGEQVHLSLPGFGWIYDRKASQNSGVEFLSRGYGKSATEFVFSALKVGRYTLAFQQQDSSTGDSARRRIAVDVSRESVQDRQTAESEEEPADSAAGQPEQLQGFSFERLEDAVLAHNSRNTAQQVQALLLSSRNGDSTDSTDMPPEVVPKSGFTDRQRKLILEAGQLLFDTEREVLAERVLKLYLDTRKNAGAEASVRSSVNANDSVGQALYLLGQIYESPPPPRDVRRSVEYYRRIVNFYPTDPYRRRAEERIKYLQRHFLQIR